MPELGEIKHATELGYENNNYYYTFIECPDCHKRRWEAYIHNQPRRIRCQACGIKLSKLLRGEYEEPCNPSTPPILGEIRHSRDLGKTTRYQMIQKYIYIKCPDCGIERWVCYAPYLKPSSICNKCSHKHQRGVTRSL